MNRNEQLLPLGSIVLLKEGMQKLVIIGRGAVYEDAGTGSDRFADYMGAIYPTGINPEKTIFFQHENIDKVVFIVYSDEEEVRFLEIYDEWQQGLVDASENETYTAESFGF